MPKAEPAPKAESPAPKSSVVRARIDAGLKLRAETRKAIEELESGRGERADSIGQMFKKIGI